MTNDLNQNPVTAPAPSLLPPPPEKPERRTMAEIMRPSTPSELSAREIWKIYNNTPRKDVGIFEKFGIALSNETVIARAWESMFGGREFTEEEGFRVTEEDIERFASDLPEYQVNRVIADSGSFAEFIYETDQARVTNRKRREVFSGGALGIAGGLGVTMLAAGGEAVALTLLATAIGGPLGGATQAGNAVSRISRVSGMLRAMGIAAAIDVPLETARYNLDNTLRPLDIGIAIGAGQTLSGAIGAWKPHLFMNFSKTAAIKETADAVEAAGDTALAASIRDRLKPVTSREELSGLSSSKLSEKAEELGISVSEVRGGKETARTPEDIIEDIMSIGRKKRVTTKALDHVRTLGTDEFLRTFQALRGGSWTKTTELAKGWLKEIKKTDFFKKLSPENRKLIQDDPLGTIRGWRDDPVTAPMGFRELEEMVADALIAQPRRRVFTTTEKGGYRSRMQDNEFFFDPNPVKSTRKRLGGTARDDVATEAEELGIPTTRTSSKKVEAAKGKWRNKLKKELDEYILNIAKKHGIEKIIKSWDDYGAKKAPSIVDKIPKAFHGEIGELVHSWIKTGAVTRKQARHAFDAGEGELKKLIDEVVEALLEGRTRAGGDALEMRFDPSKVKGATTKRTKSDIIEDIIKESKRKLDVEEAAEEAVPPRPKSDDAPPPRDSDDAPPPRDPDDAPPPRDPDDAEVADDISDLADMIRIREEDLGGEVDRFTVFGHGQGLRETAARGIDVLVPELPGLKHIFNFFAPVAIRMLRSESPVLRQFANVFLEHPRLGGQNVTTVAKSNVERINSRLFMDIEKAKVAARKAGTELDDIKVIRALRSGEEFEGPLGDAVRAIRKFNSETLKYGKEGGLFVEGIPESVSYFHRAYRSTAFSKAIATHGEDEVVEFFTQAVLRHPTSVKNAITDANAKSIARRIVEYGRDPAGARSWKDTQVMLNKMRTKLIDEGIPEDQVDDFLEAISPNMNNQPHISYGKRRLDLDETYIGRLGGKEVHIDEFLDNNLLKGTSKYAQRIIGGVETRKGMRAMFGKDGESMSFGDFSSRLRKDMMDNNQKDIDVMEKMIEHVYNSLTGLPIYKDPQTMKYVMGANSFPQATVGMTLGFAQLPEIASIMMRSGFKASFQQFPTLKEVSNIFTMGIRDVLTGRQMLGMSKLKDDLAASLESFTGIGGDYRRGDHFMKRLDDMGFDDSYVTGAATRYLDYGRQTAALNPLGIMTMDTFLRRWAVRSSFQHFVNEAYKVNRSGKVVLNKGYWNNAKVRFEQIGLDKEAFERVAKVLVNPEYVEVQRGMFGNYKVKTFNVEKVADVAAFDEFALALRRHTDHMVQRQSFGESPYWVNTQVGKLLAQYRVFMLASKSKQMAAGIARGDMREAVNVVGSCGLGIIAYQLQTHYRAAGMPDMERQKYLKERLGNNDTLIKAGLMKGSYSNIFPMIADSMSWMIGKEPIFDPTMRTTGMGIDPLTGSVPYSVLYGKAVPAAREITGAIFRGDKLSKSDIRNIQSLIFPLKMPGIEQLINRHFTSELRIPKKD